MPSSYTTRNRLTKQATGENTNTWGIILNAGAFDLIDFLSDGVTTISAGGATTLTTVNGAADQARARILNVTAATAAVITIPSVEKFYIVRAATAAATITNGSSSVTVAAGDIRLVVTDGATLWMGQQTDFANARLKNVGTPTANTDAATKLYADTLALDTFSGTVPGQASNGGKVWTTNGTAMVFQYAVADQTGASGKFLRSAGVNPDGTAAAGEWASSIVEAQRKTANYTAVSQDRLECDTTGGAFTITLPASPVAYDRVTIWDGGATNTARGFALNNLTVARNGATINSLSQDITISTKGVSVVFEYLNSTWRAKLGD